MLPAQRQKANHIDTHLASKYYTRIIPNGYSKSSKRLWKCCICKRWNITYDRHIK